MTLNIEHEMPEGVQSPKSLRPALLTPDDPRFVDWMELRHQLMEDKGWHAEGGEFDAYDENKNTKHIVLYDAEDVLTAGMRLTPIEGYDQTLSWDMVQHSPIHDEVRSAGVIDATRPVWDLTRLAVGRDVPYRVRHEAIPRLFGEGLRQCQAVGDDNPLWIFALDEGMIAWLQKQDVEVSILGSAILPGDTKPSTFGSIEPAWIAELAKQPLDESKLSSFAHRAMRADES